MEHSWLDNMARFTVSVVFLVVFLAISVCAVPGDRIKRGFGNGGNGSNGDSDYGQESEEPDVSEEGGGCGSDLSRGSPEVGYNKDGRQQPGDNYGQGGGARSFAKASASASSSAFSQNQNQNMNPKQKKNNAIP